MQPSPHLADCPRRTFADGTYRFYAAELGPAYDDARAIFRVREDADPVRCGHAKGLGAFTRLAAAREEDVETWLAAHPAYRPVAAPTAKQLRLLRRLAIERGQTFATPATPEHRPAERSPG